MSSKGFCLVGRIFVHHSGRQYRLMGIARHAKTQVMMAVYVSLETREWFVRPLTDWEEPRFTLLSDKQ